MYRVAILLIILSFPLLSSSHADARNINAEDSDRIFEFMKQLSKTSSELENGVLSRKGDPEMLPLICFPPVARSLDNSWLRLMHLADLVRILVHTDDGTKSADFVREQTVKLSTLTLTALGHNQAHLADWEKTCAKDPLISEKASEGIEQIKEAVAFIRLLVNRL